MSEAQIQPLPCPFCGTELGPISFNQTGYGVGAKLWQWHCSSVVCNAKGPSAPSVEEALELWNNRKTP